MSAVNKPAIDVRSDDKERLERQKLRAEIRELNLKIRTGVGAHRLEWSRKRRNDIAAWLGIVGLLITAGVGVFGVWRDASNFFEQQSRSREVTVTQQMLDLAKALRSPDQRLTDGAALLLSAWEQDAVPMLLYTLTWVQEPNATIEALKTVAEKKKANLAKLQGDLLLWGQRTFELEMKKPKISDEAVTAIRNYILTFHELGDCRRLGRVQPCGFQAALAKLKTEVERVQRPLEDFDRKALLKAIQDATQAIDNRK